MKNLKLVTILLITAITFASCGESVISYNDKIITPMNTIGENIDKFDTAKTEDDFNRIINAITVEAENGIKVTTALKDYNGNVAFRDAAKAYFEFNNVFFKREDITKNLMISYIDSAGTEEALNSESYLTYIDELEKLIELEDELATQQELFANANNMILEE